MNKSAFSFFRLPERPSKPRKVTSCVATDRGLPLGFVEDFLESHHDIVDYVKFADHAGIASRYSADLWHRKLAICHKKVAKLLRKERAQNIDKMAILLYNLACARFGLETGALRKSSKEGR